MDRDRRGDIGAVAGEFQHIAAAEAETDRGAAVVDQIALAAFGDHRIVGGADASALLRRVFA